MPRAAEQLVAWMWAGLAGAACAWLAVGAGCASARRGEPIVGPFVAEAPEEIRGREVFMRSCHQCHPGGDAGLGPAINNKPVPQWLVKFQVRNGLGAMPAFGEDRISDGELDDLVKYVTAMRRRG
jgi:mono/diheme cytochrome c family protein